MHQRKFGVGEEGNDHLGHDVVVMTHDTMKRLARARSREVRQDMRSLDCLCLYSLYQQNRSLPLRKMPRHIHNFDGKEDECDVQ